MKNIKETFTEFFGNTTGGILMVIVCYVLPFIFYAVPIYALGLPDWLSIIILAAFYFFDNIGAIGMWVAYIWGFIRMIQQPIGIYSIIFFAFFAVLVLHAIASVISAKKNRV